LGTPLDLQACIRQATTAAAFRSAVILGNQHLTTKIFHSSELPVRVAHHAAVQSLAAETKRMSLIDA